MRMTSTTSAPVIAKEMTAAGPAARMTTPLPTKSPAPMTPPSAIICMWRRRSERRSPASAGNSVVSARSTAIGTAGCGAAPSGELLVFREIADRFRQGIPAERIPELLRHHHLEHRGLAVALCPRGIVQRRRDVGESLDGHPLAAEGARHRRPARVLEIHALIAARVEVDVILFLRAPLSVVEHDHGDADALARTGEQFVEADAPRAVPDIGEARTPGARDLRAADDREGVAAVAEAHRSEHRARLLEAKVGVRNRADVADVGGDHGIRRHGLLERPQHLARVHVLRAARHLERVRIAFLRPCGELGFPGGFLGGNAREALGAARGARERPSLEPLEERGCGGARIRLDADRDGLHEPEHARVAVDLDDLRLPRPVVETVLRQGAEGTEARAECEYDIRLRDELHGGLRALIAEGTRGERMGGGEGVVVQIAVADR